MLGNHTEFEGSSKSLDPTRFGISEDTKKEYDYVVGIDFGTTYSGVAYAIVGDVDGRGVPILTEVSKWPMCGNQVTNQAPTVAVYENGKMIRWGHQKVGPHVHKNGQVIVSMFKLHLDETKSVNIPPLPQGVSTVQVISDYLKALFDHAFGVMSNTLGSSISRSKLRFCLTVPAVWTENAKIVMRAAAIQAGIVDISDPQDRLLLVSEPEAAALYCETFIKQYDLGHQDTFLICDAGIETVYSTVYRINKEGDENYLTEEIVGDGATCGSVTLDLRFRKFVSDNVSALTRDKISPELSSLELDDIVRVFSKSQKLAIYDPSDANYDEDLIPVTLPHRFASIEAKSQDITIEDCTLYIPPMVVIKNVFDPVVNQVLTSIHSQFSKIKGNLDAIFLVGSFGQFPLLFTRLKAKFDYAVRLICIPSRGEMAIVRGAVLMGLNPRFVKKRVVRRTYGYECALEFVEGLDPENLKTETKDGEFFCNKRFLQYAKKGEIKGIDYFAETSFMNYYSGNPVLHLFGYDGDINKIPRHTTDPNVKNILDFVIELPFLQGKKSSDLIEINVKFYLYQTEIKLQIEIENHIRIYTGSLNIKKIKKMLGDLNL